ncbi:hypothetical protein [Streptomyces liliifuscus]|uniref:Uncharacterized protein n=1 Tax=Streptomyces liliifuscus TaxID=2797636 RepID=A0A7T7RGR8_9ACTN|nr:hypothetical protein [Streptomyces liliifuscus]QQM46034.1 hypothetical protein JEQ17_45905 [Streptomyces liliifuscus]
MSFPSPGNTSGVPGVCGRRSDIGPLLPDIVPLLDHGVPGFGALASTASGACYGVPRLHGVRRPAQDFGSDAVPDGHGAVYGQLMGAPSL